MALSRNTEESTPEMGIPNQINVVSSTEKVHNTRLQDLKRNLFYEGNEFEDIDNESEGTEENSSGSEFIPDSNSEESDVESVDSPNIEEEEEPRSFDEYSVSKNEKKFLQYYAY